MSNERGLVEIERVEDFFDVIDEREGRNRNAQAGEAKGSARSA